MANPNPNEPKSVSMILKQRQQSRSSNLAPKPGSKNSPGPPGQNVNENLNPVLPPLYPSAPKSIPLHPEEVVTVKVYNELSQYLRSNFSVTLPPKGGSDGFYVDRYTDQYKSPLALKPHLLHKLPNSKYPEELTKAKVSCKPVISRRKKRKLEDLSDAEDGEKEGVPGKNPDNAEEEDEEKEETQNVDDNDDVISPFTSNL